MRIDVVSIFPDYLAPLRLSLIGKAITEGRVTLGVHDLRDWATDRHRTVDDTPYGGGAGMVMRPDVWGEAIDSIAGLTADLGPLELIVPTPAGEVFTQRLAEDLATRPRLLFACGRYEGIDARLSEHYSTRDASEVTVREVSIGDYVLAGGEAAVLVMVEAIVRLIPGVLGNPDSLVEESHAVDGELEYPVYTKPPMWRGLAVPEILLSGDHGRIAAWRREQAAERTARRGAR